MRKILTRTLVFVVSVAAALASLMLVPASTPRSNNIPYLAPGESLDGLRIVADAVVSNPDLAAAIPALLGLPNTVLQPAHADVLAIVPFFQWLWEVLNRGKTAQTQQANGNIMLLIYRPDNFKAYMNAKDDGPITRGPYDLSTSLRLIKSKPGVPENKAWHYKLQFMFIMLKDELRKMKLFQDMGHLEDVEKRWHEQKKGPYLLDVNLTTGESPVTQINAKADFGGNTNQSQASVVLTIKTLAGHIDDYASENNLGEWATHCNEQEEPECATGRLFRVHGPSQSPVGVTYSLIYVKDGKEHRPVDCETIQEGETKNCFVPKGFPILLVLSNMEHPEWFTLDPWFNGPTFQLPWKPGRNYPSFVLPSGDKPFDVTIMLKGGAGK